MSTDPLIPTNDASVKLYCLVLVQSEAVENVDRAVSRAIAVGLDPLCEPVVHVAPHLLVYDAAAPVLDKGAAMVVLVRRDPDKRLVVMYV